VRAGALVVPLLSAASLMDVEAIIYQELSLLSSLSVSENIFFVRESHRLPVWW
jgi:ABC-type sugar transport system ATPase subunit